MGLVTIRAVRVVIVLMFTGLLVAQAAVLPLLAAETAAQFPEAAHLRLPVLVAGIAGLATVQVALVCIWRLLTMVRLDTVFSRAAFRYVDVIIAAAGGATLLTVGLFIGIPRDLTPPALALVEVAAAVGGTGIALLVLVMRSLLAKAVALDTSATELQTELDEVI